MNTMVSIICHNDSQVSPLCFCPILSLFKRPSLVAFPTYCGREFRKLIKHHVIFLPANFGPPLTPPSTVQRSLALLGDDASFSVRHALGSASPPAYIRHADLLSCFRSRPKHASLPTSTWSDYGAILPDCTFPPGTLASSPTAN